MDLRPLLETLREFGVVRYKSPELELELIPLEPVSTSPVKEDVAEAKPKRPLPPMEPGSIYARLPVDMIPSFPGASRPQVMRDPTNVPAVAADLHEKQLEAAMAKFIAEEQA